MIIKKGSGALPGKMLDLGLLKISWRGEFSYFQLRQGGGLTLQGPIVIPFMQTRLNKNSTSSPSSFNSEHNLLYFKKDNNIHKYTTKHITWKL